MGGFTAVLDFDGMLSLNLMIGFVLVSLSSTAACFCCAKNYCMPAWFFLDGVCLGVFCTDELRDDCCEPACDGAFEGAWEFARELVKDE